jgi:hypothetical protein
VFLRGHWRGVQRGKILENWQNGLVSGILRSIAVAVCIGQVGIGPWEDEEMQASLAIAVREKRRIIPVMLANAPDKPDLSLFLANRTWVAIKANADSAPGLIEAARAAGCTVVDA